MDWTSCSKTLPKYKTPVLLFIVNIGVTVGVRLRETPGYEDTFSAYDYWDSPTDDGQDWEWNDVTHWMPLPKPPADRRPHDA